MEPLPNRLTNSDFPISVILRQRINEYVSRAPGRMRNKNREWLLNTNLLIFEVSKEE